MNGTGTHDREVRRYCDELLLALRVREVPGDRIGAVLAEVRTHLADSGERPEDAFGPADEYAVAVSTDVTPPSARSRAGSFLLGVGIFLGVWELIEGVGALLLDDEATLGPVPLLAAVLVGLVAPKLVDAAATPSRRGFALSVVLGMVVATGLGALLVLGSDVAAVRVPAVVPLLVGVLLLAVAWVKRPAADPVVDPLAR